MRGRSPMKSSGVKVLTTGDSLSLKTGGTDRGPRPPRLYQEVAARLEAMMRSENYRSGSRLPPERELVKRLGVSRQTVREALLALEIAKIVEIKIGSGVFVRDRRPNIAPSLMLPPEPGPAEVLEIRRVIEGESVYRATMRADDTQLEELTTIVKQTSKTVEDYDAYNVLDRRLHVMIAECSGNSLIAPYVDHLWDFRKGPLWNTWYLGSRSVEHRRRSATDHREIVSFMRQRQPDEARIAMLAHIDRLVQRFMSF